MNSPTCLSEREIPLLVMRGGCALKKMPRSLRNSRADGVVAYEQLYCERQPVRSNEVASRHLAWCRGHPSSRGGDYTCINTVSSVAVPQTLYQLLLLGQNLLVRASPRHRIVAHIHEHE